LIADGPTDTNLIPILNWSLKEKGNVALPNGIQAKLGLLPKIPSSLEERMVKAIEMHPCDLLFVHRDAEGETMPSRIDEIRRSFGKFSGRITMPVVAVVPVRMLEAWLCFDESAIRNAAGNPNGQSPLNLPTLRQIESKPDPKEDLKKALRSACELSGRRLKKFDTAAAFWRIVDYIDDFSPLRNLPAFKSFEMSIEKLGQNGWRPGFYG
jgi:hypothetical protein